MTTKNLTILAATAVVLGVAAYFTSSGSKPSTPKLNGKAILPALKVADVASIAIGEKLKLVAAADGWKVASSFNYPADREKIAENVLKLSELKAGQVARGRKLGTETKVTLAGADGKELASLTLGDKHNGKAKGQMAMFGGGAYPDGRYVAFKGETVLVKETLDAFDGDMKSWCSTRIASIPSADVKGVAFGTGDSRVVLEKGTNSVWQMKGLKANEELDTSKTYSLDSALSYLDFTSVVDPKLTPDELGLTTGAVYAVTVKDGSNTVTRVATVGNVVKGGSDRYFKMDGDKWTYTISSYAAESMMKKRADLVKVKEEPKGETK